MLARIPFVIAILAAVFVANFATSSPAGAQCQPTWQDIFWPEESKCRIDPAPPSVNTASVTAPGNSISGEVGPAPKVVYVNSNDDNDNGSNNDNGSDNSDNSDNSDSSDNSDNSDRGDNTGTVLIH